MISLAGCTLWHRRHRNRKKYNAKCFTISVDALEDNKGFAEPQHANFPLAGRLHQEIAEAYGVLGPNGMANRSTFYIGKDGKIVAIDKEVMPATSAEDMAAKLHDLGVPARH